MSDLKKWGLKGLSPETIYCLEVYLQFVTDNQVTLDIDAITVFSICFQQYKSVSDFVMIFICIRHLARAHK